MMEETPREKRNRQYLAYRERNPGRSYAQWLHEAAVAHVRTGGRHATLGDNLGHDDWWEAGRTNFERYLKLLPIRPDSKLVDYGCGSLRIGAHFIRYLDPGRYFGLDITTGLIDAGKEIIGGAMLAGKQPLFGAIEEEALAKAVAFGADFVCSTAVCYHVHPDEAPVYFGNLARLTAKTGATLFFDASLSDTPVSEHALSMPLDYFVAQLKPLEFVAFHKNAVREDGRQVLGILEFRRAEAPAPKPVEKEVKQRKKRKWDLSLPRKGRRR
ncbi:MAG TPA: class I SAM-dependent methyltransferase [Rhizomicrobium sp.]|nr:class I SAM-dependent methyltransferase [Rhizomicrobium sp.]